VSSPTILIRPCFQQDLEQVTLIYAHHVMTGTGTFELAPPSLETMTERWSHIVAKNWPFVVASPTHDLTRVLGYAYAAQFRDRAAYSYCFEDSVYIAPSAQGQGVGTRLLAEVLAILKGDGVREVLAVVGDSANAASIKLHAKLGFVDVGVMRNVGLKFDRWLDVVILQRSLGA
jgi:L-amino acid N-acyltransferase YncA